MKTISLSKNTIKKTIRNTVENSPFRSIIQRVSLFGSHAYGYPTKKSDIDILITFTPHARVGFFQLHDIQETLERQLNKSVDVITPPQLSKYFKRSVLHRSELIYER